MRFHTDEDLLPPANEQPFFEDDMVEREPFVDRRRQAFCLEPV
jgi:hypothetical protein